MGIRVNVDLAALPWPPGFLDGPWVWSLLHWAVDSGNFGLHGWAGHRLLSEKVETRQGVDL